MLETLIRHLDMVRLTLGTVLLAVMMTGCVGIIGDDPDDGLTPNQRKARDLFTSKALPIMEASCTTCHATTANVDFLKGASPLEIYETIKNFQPQQLNYIDAAKSRLITKGDHSGPAFQAVPRMGELDSDYEVILEWLRAEQRAGGDSDGGDGGDGPKYIVTGKIRPTVCAGTRADCTVNEFPLTTVNLDGTGVDAKITFLYEVLESSNAPYLANLKLVGGAEGGYVESPLFLGYEAGSTAPTVDGDTFFDIKANVMPNMESVIGSGFAGLTDIKAKDEAGMINELAMSFQVVGKYKPEGGTPDPTICKAVASFVTNVKPILLQSCGNCHNDTAGNGGAKGNMTITPANDMASCQQAKANASNLNNIPATAIFIAPKPGASGHPFKLPNSAAWEQAVTTWLTEEKNAP